MEYYPKRQGIFNISKKQLATILEVFWRDSIQVQSPVANSEEACKFYGNVQQYSKIEKSIEKPMRFNMKKLVEKPMKFSVEKLCLSKCPKKLCFLTLSGIV